MSSVKENRLNEHHLNIRRQIERGYIIWMHIFIKIKLLKVPILIQKY